ncbi:unnamed protein product, partial [Callosobruchus maculatus]
SKICIFPEISNVFHYELSTNITKVIRSIFTTPSRHFAQ